jgi:hypothetical protein
MEKIIFTRTYQIISIVAGVLIILAGVLGWFFLVKPQQDIVTTGDSKIAALNAQVSTEQVRYNKLKNGTSLLDSDVVAKIPKISNGFDYTEQLQNIQTLVGSSVKVKAINYTSAMIYPSATPSKSTAASSKTPATGTTGATAKQDENVTFNEKILVVDMTMDSKETFATAIQKMEYANQFISVDVATYRYSTTDGTYSATLNIAIPYLTNFDTDKPVKNTSSGG